MLGRLVRCVLAALALAGCALVAGPCEVLREPGHWFLACQTGGTAIVAPVSTLEVLTGAAKAASGPVEAPK